jgi:hypothetical protein
MDAHQNFLNCTKTQDQTTEEFLENLTLWADTIEYHGGAFVENYKLADAAQPDGTPRTETERRSAARDGADPTLYGTLVAELSNQFARGRNDYPRDLTSAYSLLVNYRTPANARPRNTGGNDNNASQQGQHAPSAPEDTSDPTRYGTLVAELSNQFARGRNDYPRDLTSAYSFLHLRSHF